MARRAVLDYRFLWVSHSRGNEIIVGGRRECVVPTGVLPFSFCLLVARRLPKRLWRGWFQAISAAPSRTPPSSLDTPTGGPSLPPSPARMVKFQYLPPKPRPSRSPATRPALT